VCRPRGSAPRKQSALFGHPHRRVEQLGDGVVLDEAVAVLAECGVVPHGVFDRQADEQRNSKLYWICSTSWRSLRTL
jgi:hypothetical protein